MFFTESVPFLESVCVVIACGTSCKHPLQIFVEHGAWKENFLSILAKNAFYKVNVQNNEKQSKVLKGFMWRFGGKHILGNNI